MPQTFKVEFETKVESQVRTSTFTNIIQIGAAGRDGVGGGSSPSYLHTQSSPATTWTVNHNLGTRPAVEVRTVGGMVVIAEVQHVSANQCVIYLAAAMAGTAFCTL